MQKAFFKWMIRILFIHHIDPDAATIFTDRDGLGRLAHRDVTTPYI